MPFVLDASTALSWVFQDERDSFARASANAVIEHGATVPAIWRWEVENALLSAERQKRTTWADVETVTQELAALPIEVEPVGPALTFGAELDIARRMNLSAHDAAYVEIALRRGFRLITRDAKLAAAADSMKIRWKP